MRKKLVNGDYCHDPNKVTQSSRSSVMDPNDVINPNDVICLSENDREKSEEPHCDVKGNKTGLQPVSMTFGKGSLFWRMGRGCQDFADRQTYRTGIKWAQKCAKLNRQTDRQIDR